MSKWQNIDLYSQTFSTAPKTRSFRFSCTKYCIPTALRPKMCKNVCRTTSLRFLKSVSGYWHCSIEMPCLMLYLRNGRQRPETRRRQILPASPGIRCRSVAVRVGRTRAIRVDRWSANREALEQRRSGRLRRRSVTTDRPSRRRRPVLRRRRCRLRGRGTWRRAGKRPDGVGRAVRGPRTPARRSGGRNRAAPSRIWGRTRRLVGPVCRAGNWPQCRPSLWQRKSQITAERSHATVVYRRSYTTGDQSSSSFPLQCSDTVGWTTGRTSDRRKAGCWFVSGDSLTGAL